MKIVYLSIIFIFHFSNIILSKTFPSKIITHEARYYNACFKEVDKKLAKAEKEAAMQEKKNDTSHYLFNRFLGGIKIEFDNCIKNRRTKNENDFIEKLAQSDKIEFKENVRKEINRKYPKIKNRY